MHERRYWIGVVSRDHVATFIRSKTHWGVAFRYDLVRVPRDDFATIATAMGRNPDVDFG